MEGTEGLTEEDTNPPLHTPFARGDQSAGACHPYGHTEGRFAPPYNRRPTAL